MKRLLTLVAFFATLQASAQQVNPVPDYVFSNRMSAGRNTVTDTAAYFSIGPRYGATRGMMPPMVVDTASFSANKRNGLLIFSVQKNKFLYWDSVGVKWAEMAGTGGSAITGSGVAGYMPEFTTTTNLDTTRLYHSAGRFVIGSTTTTNGVFNVYGGTSYFDTSLLVGTNTLFADEANNRVGIGTTSPSGILHVSSVTSAGRTNVTFINPATANTSNRLRLRMGASSAFTGTDNYPYIEAVEVNASNSAEDLAFGTYSGSTLTEKFRITSSGNVGIGVTNPESSLTVNRALAAEAGSTSYGSALIRGNNYTLSNTRRGILDIELTDAAAQNLGATLTFTNNYTQFGNNLHYVGAAFKAGIETSINTDQTTYLATYTNNGGTLSERMRIKADGELLLNTTSDAGAYVLQVSGAIYNTTTITTGAPTSGSAKPWRLGEVATVSPTSPNRTIRVEIDGTVYYLHAKTTND